MNQRSYQEIQAKRAQLQSAQSELQELEDQIRTFEATVDDRLGNLLDLLSELKAETDELDAKLRNIRERRLFGEDLIRYLDGAPRSARPPNLKDLPPMILTRHNSDHKVVENTSSNQEQQIPDIRVLYRKLARRYHPDLARSDADRAMSNEQMAEINQAYQAGDIPTLMRLAGVSLPYGVNLPQPPVQFVGHPIAPMTEQDQLDLHIKTVRQEIARLSRLPIVKLSLDVKLARHQRRDLLGEMAYDLQRKVGRKIAERDYLQAQIKASGGIEGDSGISAS
jgi:hypothetical protein